MASVRWLLALLLLAALALPSLAAVDESPYRASSTVKLYHKYTIELNVAYFQKVAMNTALPVAIVGMICFFVVAIWTCCRCCGNCRVKEDKVSNRFRIFVVVIICCITLACIGMLIYGFKADETQSKAMKNIPELVDNVILWKNQSVAALQNLINITNMTISEVNTLLNTPGICGTTISCTEATQIVQKCQDIATKSNEIIQNLGNLELNTIKDKISERATFVDDYRHMGMVILLSVLFGTIVLQAIITLMDSRCPTQYQVRKYCIGKLITVLITLSIIILIFLIWFLAALLLFTSVVFADFCIAPANNIIRMASISDSITQYYLTCDQDPNMINPLATQLGVIDSARNLTRDYIAQLNQSAQSCTVNQANCDTARSLVNNIGVKTDLLFVAVGVPDSTGNSATGILAQFSCRSLNGKVQAVFHLVCDDFFLSAAQTFEVIIAFAGLFVLLQIFVGMSANRTEDDDATVRPTIYGYGEKNDMEMKPPAYGEGSGSGHVMYGGNAQNI